MVPTQSNFVQTPDDRWLGIFRLPHLRDWLETALDRAGTRQQRNRALSSLAGLAFVLLMVLRRDLSIPNVLAEMAAPMQQLEPGADLKPVTNEALIKRRKRLGFETLKHLFELTAAAVEPLRSSFGGLRTLIIDGTYLDVPDTLENSRRFGRCKATKGRSAFPHVMLVVLMEATTRQVIAAVIQRCDQAEVQAAWYLSKNLKPGDVVILDSGYASAALFEHLVSLGVHVLMRMKALTKPTVLKSFGAGDNLVRMTSRAPKWRKRWTPRAVIARFVTYRVDGGKDVIRLASSFLDPKKVHSLTIAQMYRTRWQVELSFKEVKKGLIRLKSGVAQTHLRSHLPELVLQEAYAFLALYNIVRGLMRDAAEAYGLDPLDIGFVDTVEHLKRMWSSFSLASPQRNKRLFAALTRQLAEFTNSRPRRGRVCPRVVKKRTSRIPVKTAAYKETKVPQERCLIFVDVLEPLAA